MKITTIGFDADDTLWHNERFYVLTQDRFADLLADHTATAIISMSACSRPNGATSGIMDTESRASCCR